MRGVSKALIQWLTPERVNLYPPHIPAITLIAYLLSLSMGSGLSDFTGRIIGSDFLAFYTGGNFFLTGRMDDLYDIQAQYRFQRSLHPLDRDTLYYFVNPPFTVLFFSLFSRGTYIQGLAMWWVGGVLAVLAAIHIVRSEFGSLRQKSTARLFFLCCLFFPSLCWFMYGQNTAFSLLLYVFTFVALRRGKDLNAGFALGALLYKPQLIMGFLLVIMVQRRWKALLGLSLAAGLWIVAGFTIHAPQMMEYLRLAPHLTELLRLRPDERIIGAFFHLGIGTSHPAWGIHSLFGFFSLLLDDVSREAANYFYLISALACTFLILKLWYRKPWDPGSRRWDLSMAISTGLGLLASPQLFTYDLMLLLLPLAIVWNRYPEGTGGRLLDAGPLLFWSFALYIASFAGAYFSLAQLKLLSWLGGPVFAVQFTTLILLRWLYEIHLSGK